MFVDLNSALKTCLRLEKKTGVYHYVIFNVPTGEYVITDTMPFLGEWYDSDGIRHG